MTTCVSPLNLHQSEQQRNLVQCILPIQTFRALFLDGGISSRRDHAGVAIYLCVLPVRVHTSCRGRAPHHPHRHGHALSHINTEGQRARPRPCKVPPPLTTQTRIGSRIDATARRTGFEHAMAAWSTLLVFALAACAHVAPGYPARRDSSGEMGVGQRGGTGTVRVRRMVGRRSADTGLGMGTAVHPSSNPDTRGGSAAGRPGLLAKSGPRNGTGAGVGIRRGQRSRQPRQPHQHDHHPSAIGRHALSEEQ